ncbi:hypothetical protein DXG01_009800 [Tephrocybe rancida]|nr:hypothetical protein DXG01_009800 [Tephrocybe rancida]
MVVFPKFDTDLALKVEGAVANQTVLSDQDKSSCLAFMSEARSRIMDYESCISILQKQISQIGLAISHHGLLPTEILREIFLYLIHTPFRLLFPEYATLMRPSQASDMPWVLGRVCSLWRQISRAMPELWGAFKITYPSSDLSFRCALRAREVLPPVALLSIAPKLYYHDHLALGLDFTANVVPHLGVFDELMWTRVITSVTGFHSLIPLHSLSNLISLTLYLERTEEEIPFTTRGTVALFGQLPRLTKLHLKSVTPEVFRWDIPWGQLECLDFSEARMTAFVGSETPSPSVSMPQLQALSLDLNMIASRLLLTTDIPWQNLTKMTLNRIDEAIVRDVCEILLKTHMLKALTLDFQYQAAILQCKPPIPDSLTSFSVLQVPNGLLDSFSRAGRLTFLHISPSSPLYSAGTLYNVLKQCPCLEHLQCNPGSGQLSPGATQNLFLPYLHRLDLDRLDDGQDWMFTSLTAPRLAWLKIEATDQFKTFAPITQFLLREGTVLTLWFFEVPLLPGHFAEDREGLAAHLVPLHRATTVISSYTNFDEHILRRIATQEFLPRVETMILGSSSLDAFVTMLEDRLPREQALGAVTLKECHCRSLVSRTGEAENGGPFDIDNRLIALEKRFDVKCTVISEGWDD